MATGAPRELAQPRLLICIAVLVLLAMCRESVASPDFDRMRQRLESLRVELNVPGLAVTIVDRDRVLWADGLGVTDIHTRQAVTPDTVFRIGSITKTFTAVALLLLQEDGRLDLSDPVRKHVPDAPYANPWEHERPITIAELLEHTAGFQDWTKAEFDNNDPTPLTLEQGLAYSPDSRTARWKPGMHSVYSNSDYGLAGLVIERVSGKRYEDFVAHRLFAPLEMHSATLLPDQGTLLRLATGYDLDGRTPIPYWNLIQRPAGAINATPREMAALVQMLLNRGVYRGRTLLSKDSIARMETPRTSLAARHGLAFGYGLGNHSRFRNGFLFHGHGGDGDGYLSHYAYCRELGLGYFVTINSANPLALRAVRRLIENSLTHGETAAPPPAPAFIERVILQRYTGRYELAAWRFPWQNSGEHDAKAIVIRLLPAGFLVTEDGDGERNALIPVTSQQFRRGPEHGATAAFIEEDGRLYFQEDENWVKVGEID